jgi:hypothetical protein
MLFSKPFFVCALIEEKREGLKESRTPSTYALESHASYLPLLNNALLQYEHIITEKT